MPRRRPRRPRRARADNTPRLYDAAFIIAADPQASARLHAAALAAIDGMIDACEDFEDLGYIPATCIPEPGRITFTWAAMRAGSCAQALEQARTFLESLSRAAECAPDVMLGSAHPAAEGTTAGELPGQFAA